MAQSRTEIGASDDSESDDNFSDDSLEDISTILGRVRPRDGAMPAPGPRPSQATGSPVAKRTASTTHKSPLAILPKHKFDLKALAKDARRDFATQASSERLQALVRDPSSASLREGSPASTIPNIFQDDEDGKAEKVLQAVQRSKPAAQNLSYRFFSRNIPPRNSKLPKDTGGSRWQLLTKGDAKAREASLCSRIPRLLVSKARGQFPDSLFEWILQEICVQQSVIMRDEYSNIVADCPDHIKRLISVETIQKMLYHLGAQHTEPDWSKNTASLDSEENYYQGREWSRLRSVIQLFGRVATQLPLESCIYITKMLLIMSMDKVIVCTIDVLTAYETAMEHLLDAIPATEWDQFCLSTCNDMDLHVRKQDIRLTALLCLPTATSRAHDLRRRLATSFLLQENMYAKRHPEVTVTMALILERLKERDFDIVPTTDFVELRALILLLDIALDDGNVLPFENSDVERQFNSTVDKVTACLQDMWKRINDSGMKLSRTEAKSVLEWVQKRLAMAVRTRREAKRSILDIPEQKRERPSLKQQTFMQNFLKKPAPSAGS